MRTESHRWAELLEVSPDADAVEVCRAFEQLAPSLAPHDLRWPVYGILVEMSPAFAGCFSCSAYHAMRKHLPIDRGFGVVLLASTSMLNRIPPEYTMEVLCLILAHELAHALRFIADGMFREWQETFAEVAERPAVTAALQKDIAPMLDGSLQKVDAADQLAFHGLGFTRIAVHLAYRLSCAGNIDIEQLAAGKNYGQRNFQECYAALGNEPTACHDKSFQEIVSLPLPVPFAACRIDQ